MISGNTIVKLTSIPFSQGLWKSWYHVIMDESKAYTRATWLASNIQESSSRKPQVSCQNTVVGTLCFWRFSRPFSLSFPRGFLDRLLEYFTVVRKTSHWNWGNCAINLPRPELLLFTTRKFCNLCNKLTDILNIFFFFYWSYTCFLGVKDGVAVAHSPHSSPGSRASFLVLNRLYHYT